MDAVKKAPDFKLYLAYLLAAACGFSVTALFFHYFPNPLGQPKSALPAQVAQPVVRAPVVMPVQQPKIQPPKQEPVEKQVSEKIPSQPEPESRYSGQDKIPSRPSFVLNGIVISDNQRYALINNEIVKVGDNIGGAVVINILPGEVNLKVGDSEIRLK